jgi:hypothetical protein
MPLGIISLVVSLLAGVFRTRRNGGFVEGIMGDRVSVEGAGRPSWGHFVIYNL